MAKKVSLDFDDLTNGELELIEEHAGVTLSEVSRLMEEGKAGRAKLPYALTTVLTFLAYKRTKPDADIGEVIDAKPDDFVLELKGGDDSPLPESGESAGSPATENAG